MIVSRGMLGRDHIVCTKLEAFRYFFVSDMPLASSASQPRDPRRQVTVWGLEKASSAREGLAGLALSFKSYLSINIPMVPNCAIGT